MVDIKTRLEEHLIVKDKEGNIEESKTLEKRKAFREALLNEINKAEFELNEAELRYKLYKENPKRTTDSIAKNNFEFGSTDEWLDFEFKKLSQSFEEKIEEMTKIIDDYQKQLKVVNEYIGE